MARRLDDRFDAISKKVSEKRAESRPKAAPTHLPNTTTVLSNLSEGKVREVTLRHVAPSRIRLWSEHNRRYELLNEARCQSLIDAFKRSGKQEFPAIVRPIPGGDPKYDYELICGARRHWTANYLGWDLLIEVRKLTDRQAFILQDLENRDREDISDYERAIDYKNGLEKYFDNNQTAMAKHLDIDRRLFARFLCLSEIPKAVVDAYADISGLRVHHGFTLKPFLADKTGRQRIIKRAKELRGQNLKPADVLRYLKKAGEGSGQKASSAKKEYFLPGTKTVGVTVKSADKKSIALNINRDALKNVPALLKVIETSLVDAQ